MTRKRDFVLIRVLKTLEPKKNTAAHALYELGMDVGKVVLYVVDGVWFAIAEEGRRYPTKKQGG